MAPRSPTTIPVGPTSGPTTTGPFHSGNWVCTKAAGQAVAGVSLNHHRTPQRRGVHHTHASGEGPQRHPPVDCRIQPVPTNGKGGGDTHRAAVPATAQTSRDAIIFQAARRPSPTRAPGIERVGRPEHQGRDVCPAARACGRPPPAEEGTTQPQLAWPTVTKRQHHHDGQRNKHQRAQHASDLAGALGHRASIGSSAACHEERVSCRQCHEVWGKPEPPRTR